MIVFIPASGAEDLSIALWGLARPASKRVEADTQSMFGWLDLPDHSRWLEVDTEFSIVVDDAAELDGIAGILQPFIDAGHLPAETNAQLAAFIEAKRGETLVVYEAFPPFFKAQAKTREQMIDAGLLAQPQGGMQ